MAANLRVAWFSTLNTESAKPSPSPSAYTSDILLPLLRDRFEIELFSHDAEQYQNYRCAHYLTAITRHREAPFDFFFYQIEDHPRSDFSRIHLGLMPGIVLFHNVLFRDYTPMSLRNSPWKRVIEKFDNPELEWPRRSADNIQRGPFAYRECGLSMVPIFTSRYAANEYARLKEDGLTKTAGNGSPEYFYLPYPVKTDAAAESNKHPRPLQSAFCGSVSLEFRAHKLLLALSQLESAYQLTWLAPESEVAHANEMLAEFGIVSATVRGGLSPATWSEIAPGADVAVHTAFSVWENPDPYLSISLYSGLPSIVSRFGAVEALPSELLFSVQPGNTEAAEIGEVIKKLDSDRSLLQNLSTEIRAYAEPLHDAQAVADELSAIFLNKHDFLISAMNRWQQYRTEARESLIHSCISSFSRHGLRETEELSGLGLASRQGSWDDLCGEAFRELGWLTS